ncbi:Cell cycle checkpoint protein rad17 [Phytophthora pseudosyringae]|uniref:Cell cycle checkpoint protein rad17 n=1 Tax=Phytophthora pseudosyringae TaxID=221518 RepID=A0A8T1WJW8_9STRA|nr:Cell cycle checkpoint protein rad17 [Phytophthora pseudosyringae]
MQRGRRRLRQRAERENESVGSSSDSDEVLMAKCEDIRPQSQELKPQEKGKEWECPLCTFLNEDASASRCEVCDSARPGLPRKTRKLSQWLSQPVEKVEHKSKKKQASGAEAEPIELIDSSEGADSDDTASVTSAASCGGGGAAYSRRGNGNAGKMVTRPVANGGLWADLYAPKSVEDLCVNKKKVLEVSEWLKRNASPHSGGFQKRLLFLCGPPGSGKSTAVRCIARQLGLLIKEWEDNSAAGKLHYERLLREDFWTPQVSGVDDFSDFIHRSSAYAALPVVTSRHTSTIGRKRRLSSSQQGPSKSQAPSTSTGQLILIESWPQSWSKEHSIYEEKLQRIYQHVVDPAGGCHYPVVCIYSDVQGSKIDLDHLSRKFSREVMHSPHTSIININAVTSAQLKKHLTRVAVQENCPSQPADVQKIINSSNGDMRHALNMLQLSQNTSAKKQKRIPAAATKKGKKSSASSVVPNHSSATSSSARDPFLSDFHVVGKLLHGKMLQHKSADESELKSEGSDVGYDQILDASAMPLDRVLGLVHENSIAYFSQVEDLSGALELMSLCEVMVAESYNGVSSSGAFKRSRDVAQAILIRTVAVTNENPAPKAFRPITRPRTYTAKQRMVSRREELLVATRGGEHGLQYACTGDVFAFEVEPFLTIMDRVGGPATRHNASGSTFAIDTLSLKEVDDEIENSDDDWE